MGIGKKNLIFSRGIMFTLISFILVFLLSFESVMVVSAESDNKKTIRVAYVLWENFQEGAEGEPKSGYSYDYLKKISYYTGWKYEYVYGSFAELYEKLVSGEIDLMANISYTEERAKQIYFSNYAQGDEYFYIYGQGGQTKINGNDPTTFEGAKVGVNAGSYQIELFEKWCEENSVQCEIIEYTDFQERVDDLASGALDATVGTDAYLSLNWDPLVQIGKEPYYYGVSRERKDVLVELNSAMQAIKTANPFYNDELRTKYFNRNSSVMGMLTEDEKQWLNHSSEIRVGYLSNYIPYSDTNTNTGKMDGVGKDLLDSIKEEYGMEYDSQGFSSYPEMLQALHNNEIDVIFPAYGDPGAAELYELVVTDPVTTTTLTLYYRENKIEDIKTVAINRMDPFQEQYALLHYPEVEQIKYDDFLTCAKAVINEEVDCTIRETARIDKNHKGVKKALQTTALRDFVNISFGVREGEVELLAVLNKGIGLTDEAVITNSLVKHSQDASQFTVIEFLSEYVLETICLIVLIAGVIIGILILHYRSALKHEKRIKKATRDAEKARYESEHDNLTGLLNRKAFQDLKIKLRESTQPFALLLIDGDKFKSINDNFGHESGDLVLQRIAKEIREQFSSGDYFIRFGGDEFAAIIMNITISESIVIKDKINKMNRNLQKEKEGVPKITLSAGVAFTENGYEDELFQRADKALYETKANGGCGCTIFRQNS